jgi:hypothetical protein
MSQPDAQCQQNEPWASNKANRHDVSLVGFICTSWPALFIFGYIELLERASYGTLSEMLGLSLTDDMRMHVTDGVRCPVLRTPTFL